MNQTYRNRGRRLWMRSSQSSGPGDVVSVADFGLVAGGRGVGVGLGLLAEEGRSQVERHDGEKECGDEDGRVRVHGELGGSLSGSPPRSSSEFTAALTSCSACGPFSATAASPFHNKTLFTLTCTPEALKILHLYYRPRTHTHTYCLTAFFYTFTCNM